MKKIFFNFIKSKKGSHALEAIFIVPIWLLLLLYCTYVNTISNARQTLADESSAITNIISISSSEQDARNDVLDYIKTNKLNKRFCNDGEPSTSFLKIYDEKGQPISNENWVSGKKVQVYITIKTAFTGINFNTITLAGAKIEVFKTSYTNRCLIILNNGR